MKKKQLLWLLGALVVLTGTYFLLDDFGRNASTIRIPDLRIPIEDAESLTIVTSSDSIVIAKEDPVWMVRHPVEFLGDSTTVARLLDDVAGLALESVASSNPERYGIYGVGRNAVTVTIASASRMESLVLGDPGPDFSSLYIRVGDDPKVYFTSGRVTAYTDLDQWRDRRITELPLAAVQSVTVHRPEGGYNVVHQDGAWLVDDSPADTVAVESWLRRFNPLRADGFLDDLPPDSLADASHQLAITTSAGSTEILRLMEYDDDLAVATQEEHVTFRLPMTRLEVLIPDPTTFQPDN